MCVGVLMTASCTARSETALGGHLDGGVNSAATSEGRLVGVGAPGYLGGSPLPLCGQGPRPYIEPAKANIELFRPILLDAYRQARANVTDVESGIRGTASAGHWTDLRAMRRRAGKGGAPDLHRCRGA